MKGIEYQNIRHNFKPKRWFAIPGFLWIYLLMCSVSCDPEANNSSFLDDDVITISRYIEDNQEEYSYFWELLLSTNMKGALSAYNPNGNGYTLFMPGNQAFDKYIRNNDNYSSFEALLDDHEFANLLIRYHLVNRSFQTNDFPFGALPDTTYTGDFLTIGFSQTLDSTVYKINNVAPVIVPNIELINGYIHVIDEVLEPVAYSSYDWLFQNKDYSILAEAFTITGLADTMGVFRMNQSGKLIKNLYTILGEPDSIYQKKGVNSIDDLIRLYQTPGRENDDIENDFYQFVAYHILEGSYFLDEFSGLNNYNSYANAPVQISADFEIRINPGTDTLDIIIEGGDTTIINYVRVDMVESNILTKNGAIHVLKDVMEVFVPGRTSAMLQFYEEPRIYEQKNEPGEHELIDPETMEVLYWTGPESILYIKAGSSIPANSNDYIEIEGNFTITYSIPKILPGKYRMRLKTHRNGSENATIQVYLDGKRMGSSFDLTAGGNPYNTFTVGSVEFFGYEEHTVLIQSLLPGRMMWDFVQFEPE